MFTARSIGAGLGIMLGPCTDRVNPMNEVLLRGRKSGLATELGRTLPVHFDHWADG